MVDATGQLVEKHIVSAIYIPKTKFNGAKHLTITIVAQ